MRLLRTLLTGVAAAAATLVVPPSAASAAPSTPYTALTYDAANGSSPVYGSRSYDPSNATFTWTTYDNDGLGVAVVQPDGHYVDMNVIPPTGQTWVVGTTYQTIRGQDATHGGLDMSSDHSGCNQVAGSITIKQVERDAVTQRITAFAATYSARCENFYPPVIGELRWNSNVGYVANESQTLYFEFGSTFIGGPGLTKTINVTARGSEPTVFGTAAITGTNPEAFSVVADTCSGQSLAYGEGCLVTVNAHPTINNGQQAVLTLPNNAAAGAKDVPMSTFGRIGAKGTYYRLPSKRILDTRSGNGAPKAAIGPQGVVHLQVTGRGGVPASGVGAVVLNVTVTQPTAAGFLTVYPAGVTRPTASSLNFPKNWTGANSVTVAVGDGGKVDIYNHAGSSHVIVDVAGYYAGTEEMVDTVGLGGQFQPLKPIRIFDSRSDWHAKLRADHFVSLPLNFGEPDNGHIRAYAVNITAVTPSADGFLTAWDGADLTPPGTSTLNYTTGKVVPNMAIVPVGPCLICPNEWYGRPSISVYTSKDTHVLVDIVGFFDDSTFSDGLRFTPITPNRITDTRDGIGMPGPLGPAATGTVTTPAEIAQPGTEALALNVTAVSPTIGTYVTVWPNGFASIPKPDVSNLNPAAGQTVPNAVITLIGPTNAFNVYNHNGSTNILVDVVGTYWLYSGTASASATIGQGAAGGGGPAYTRVPGTNGGFGN